MEDIVVNGRDYGRDLIIVGDKIITDWWRVEGHRFQLKDLIDYVDLDELSVDDIIIGTGYNGLIRVDREVVEEFKRRGFQVYVLDTRRAVDKYNELVGRGRRVAAFLHLHVDL